MAQIQLIITRTSVDVDLYNPPINDSESTFSELSFNNAGSELLTITRTITGDQDRITKIYDDLGNVSTKLGAIIAYNSSNDITIDYSIIE
jgi:hypothetical protein